MRHVIWTPRARRDLREIEDYIAVDNLGAAQHLVERIVAAADSLVDFPYKGRRFKRGLRQLSTVYPYIIRYRAIRDRIEIIRVYHGARIVRSTRVAWSGAPRQIGGAPSRQLISPPCR